jgi:two-component system, sensor histidine kinase
MTPAASPLTPSRRILLVEDNPDSRDTLRTILRLWGHQVEVAEDGRTGVQMALAWKPDIGILDIGLPVLDGYQVAERLRAVLKDQIFLIALTGYSQPQDRQRAFTAGFDVHLTKPADLDELARLVAAPA